MKCNQCGGENPENSAFCAKCGTPLRPGVTVTAPVGQTGTVISSNFGSNGPTTSVSVPIKNSKLATIIVIAAFVVLAGIGALVWILVGSKGGEVISCTKDGKMLTQSVATTFKKDEPTKIEYTYIFDKTAMPDDDSGFNFSFSTDEGLKSDPEEADVFAASFMILAFEELAKEPGIEYLDNDRSTIRTVSFTADLTKVNKETKEQLLEDAPASASEFQKEWAGQGFTCQKK